MNWEVITIPQEIIDAVDIEMYGSLENAVIEKAKEAKLWCSNPNHQDKGSYYTPDTKKMKHHWRCNCCRKITQIG